MVTAEDLSLFPEKFSMISSKKLADLFCKGEYINDIDGSIWRSAFTYLANDVDPSNFDKQETHKLWTVNGGHLRRKIKDDVLILAVLKKCLPGYQGGGLWLYRGECRFLHEENLIGFCWTPKIEVAETFARGLNSIESGGVLLKAYAPSEAILTAPNNHSSTQMKEFEYTCDPWKLKEISVIKTFPKF